MAVNWEKAIGNYIRFWSEAQAWSRLWKQAAKEKRWRLILCTEAAAKRKELLRRSSELIKEYRQYMRIDVNGEDDLMNELAKELGDEN